MARFQRRRMLAPINSIKHFVHQTILNVPSGTIANITVADAVNAPAVASSLQVNVGCIIKAVYIEMWYVATDASDTRSSFTLTVEKIPSGAPGMTFTNSSNLGAYLNKKNILYTTQGVSPSAITGGASLPLLRQFISIPKGKQRMGQGDEIHVNVSSVGGASICGIFIYKEYQ